MKCIPHLALFVDVKNATFVIERLLDHVLETNAAKSRTGAPDNVSVKAMRDVSSLALKSILSELDPVGVKASAIAPILLPRLIKSISTTKAVGDATDVLIESLEILYEVLSRMGGLIGDLHSQVNDSVFVQLSSTNPLVRKRAIACLGALGSVCDNILFRDIVEKTLFDLQNPESHDTVRTGVQAIRALSKTSGHRLGTYLPTLAPILFQFASLDKHGDDDDLREHCLQALESFCLRCRREMVSFAPKLSKCVVLLAKYDPNYVVDSEEEENSAEDMAEEDDMVDDFDDDDYSDDDDSSWKVRRAAIKCLHAAVTSQLFSAEQLCTEFGPFLVTRFKEREEQVKLDVFDAFIDLLRLCSSQSRSPFLSGYGALQDIDAGDEMSVDALGENRPEVKPLVNRASQIVRSIKKELSSRSLKTRIKAMIVTRELVAAVPSIVTSLVSKVINEVEQGLLDSATAMKTESLVFLRGVVKGGNGEDLKDYIHILIPRVLSATDDRYYKVTAECLRFCEAAVSAFGIASPACKAAMSPLAPSIHDAALRRATAQDQDSEVKEVALYCLGGTISYFGTELGPERLSDVAGMLCDRLGNDVTRLATVRAMHVIATSESAEVLLPVMNTVVSTVGGFLRKNNQPLRSAALELLCVAPCLPSDNDAVLISNASELISDSDLRLASLALKLSTKIIQSRGSQVTALFAEENSIYSCALSLSTSSLLQGRAINSLLGLFRALSEVNAKPLSISKMLEDLKTQTSSVAFNITASGSHSSSLHCIAKCVVVICDAAEPALRSSIIRQLINNVSAEEFKSRVFSLACLGEFGRSSLLARGGEEYELVWGGILSALDSPQEEVKTAAALSLGGLACANGASGVPSLVTLINIRPYQRYLLLLSLKEAIASSAKSDIAPLITLLVPVLLDQRNVSAGQRGAQGDTGQKRGARTSEEESIRTATAECLGLLTQSSPDVVLQSLTDGAQSKIADVRAVVAAALKFAVSTNPNGCIALSSRLRSTLGVFIQLIGDDDVAVANNTLQAIHAIAKSRPSLLLPHLSTVLPLIYARTAKDKELVRVVDLGPFKHEEDYGLDLRKSAFDCMRTFISGALCPSIPLTIMLEHVVVGMRDQPDVRSIAQIILAIAASTDAAPQMVPIMDSITRVLSATLTERLKSNAVRQESERHEDSIRGALRAIRMMEAVPEISSNQQFQRLLTDTVRVKFVDKYKSVGKSEVELLTFGSMPGLHGGTHRRNDEDLMAD